MSQLLSQQKDGVLVAQFTCQKLYDDAFIGQIGSELVELADQSEGKMLLDFDGVKFMSASLIGRIVILNRKSALSENKSLLGGQSDEAFGQLD